MPTRADQRVKLSDWSIDQSRLVQEDTEHLRQRDEVNFKSYEAAYVKVYLAMTRD